jgi:hypothetical protein
MPITVTDPFRGRHFPGEVIILWSGGAYGIYSPTNTLPSS